MIYRILTGLVLGGLVGFLFGLTIWSIVLMVILTVAMAFIRFPGEK